MLELQETVDVGEVELDAMLIFIDRERHVRKADSRAIWFDGFSREKLIDQLGVQRKRVLGERGIV